MLCGYEARVGCAQRCMHHWRCEPRHLSGYGTVRPVQRIGQPSLCFGPCEGSRSRRRVQTAGSHDSSRSMEWCRASLRNAELKLSGLWHGTRLRRWTGRRSLPCMVDVAERRPRVRLAGAPRRQRRRPVAARLLAAAQAERSVHARAWRTARRLARGGQRVCAGDVFAW
eukprot:1029370-Pleurochrysis_carterae.AAC.2